MTSKVRFWRCATILPALTLAGCTTVTSHRDVAGGPQDGVLYFLPRQLAKVTVARKEKKLGAATDALEKALAGKDAADAAVEAATAAIKETEALIIAGAGGDAAKALLASRLAAQQADLATAKKDATDAKTAYDKAKAALADTLDVTRGRLIVKAALDHATDAQDLLGKAETDLATAGKEAETICAKVPPLSQKLEALRKANADEKALRQQERAVAIAQANCQQKESDRKAAETKRQDAVARVTEADTTVKRLGEAGKPDYATTLAIDLLPPTADPKQIFRLDPRHSLLRDDTHAIVIGTNGLLTSTDVTAVDRTVDMLVEVATFAGAVAGLAKSAAPASHRICSDADSYTSLVDLADLQSLGKLNGQLQCYGLRVKTEGQPWQPRAADGKDDYADVDGIVYRQPLDVIVSMQRCKLETGCDADDDNGWAETGRLPLSLPQAGPMAFLKQRAGYGTTSHYVNAFHDGMLASYSDTRPSEGLAIASTPIKLWNAAFDGFSKVLSLRIGVQDSLAKLATNKTATLNAQTAYQTAQIQSEATLIDATKNVAAARAALQAAALNGEQNLTQGQIDLLAKQVALQKAQATSVLDVTTAQTNAATTQANAAASLTSAETAQAVAIMRKRAQLKDIRACLAALPADGKAQSCLP